MGNRRLFEVSAAALSWKRAFRGRHGDLLSRFRAIGLEYCRLIGASADSKLDSVFWRKGGPTWKN